MQHPRLGALWLLRVQFRLALAERIKRTVADQCGEPVGIVDEARLHVDVVEH